MTKILGIDTGTNSLGWAIVEKKAEQYCLLDKGVNIFQEGVNIDKDNYNPQNEAFLHSRTSRAISQNETYRRNTPYPPLKNRPAYAGIHIL